MEKNTPREKEERLWEGTTKLDVGNFMLWVGSPDLEGERYVYIHECFYMDWHWAGPQRAKLKTVEILISKSSQLDSSES